ncbi:MAG TPA: benzoate-CoA ligase family protein [Ktedonobacterales bacterium]|nr:benzoate-CoA ligase family protein [Ktedonobacterales bacterium]
MSISAHVDTFVRDHLPPRDEWPDFIFTLPELQYPDQINCVAELVDRWVLNGHGAAPAISGADGMLTYWQLQEQVDQVAHVLIHDMGLVPGNRVLLRSANNPMMAVCWLAAAKAGLVIVATMPLLREKELTEVIEKAQISAALCDKRLDAELLAAQQRAPVLTQIVYFSDPSPEGLEARMAAHRQPFNAVDTAADDPVLIAFTSGSTGKPKATIHFHRDILAICDTFPKSIVQMTADEVCIGTPPLAFTFGLGGLLLFPLRVGASTVLLERFTPDSMLQAIQQYGATTTWTAPLFYRQMAALAKGQIPPTLRKCVSAGEMLPASTRALFKEATGIEIIDGIGSTEMLHIFIAAAGADVRPGATGKPVPGYEARILDDDGQPLPAGQVGRLAVRGPTGCRYMADERQRVYVQHGWNLTGDAYLMDEDGYFWFQARTDDIIVTGGYNVAGPEVENTLLEHPAVAECAVVGAPDPERGTIIKAFIVLKPGYTGDDALAQTLQEFVKQRIAPYKYPRAVEFCATLPRAETGKLQRFRLRQQEQQKEQSGANA